MSDHFSDQNNAKLSNTVDNLDYFQQFNDSLNLDEINHAYDHMYATNHQENGLTEEEPPRANCQSSAESEVNFLKEFLLIHLDLIQQQNDDLLSKDSTIYLLQQENEKLKERISCLEKSQSSASTSVVIADKISPESSPQSQSCSEDMTLDSSVITDENREHVVGLPETEEIITITPTELVVVDNQLLEPVEPILLEEEIKLDQTIEETDIKSQPLPESALVVEPECSKCDTPTLAECEDTSQGSAKDFAHTSYTIHTNSYSSDDPMKNLKMSIRRKRLCSTSSILSNNDSASDERRHYRRRSRKKRKRLLLKNDHILTSEEQYLTQVGDEALDALRREELAEQVARAANLEVPMWRVKVYTSCYSMEGTENLEDEVYLRRHSKLENDERRRKRWDVQRIREQRIVDKLKQRQDKLEANRISEQSDIVESLWPSIDDIKYIEMCDSLPVSAFGCPVPKVQPSEFSIPWLNNPNMKKPVVRKQPTGRRRKR